MTKKLVSLMLAAGMLTVNLAGCGTGTKGIEPSANESTVAQANTTETNTTEVKKLDADKKKIVFWYFHTGEEAKIMEQATKDFNEIQDEYLVEALSVSDKQKYIVAISGNESPDVIEISNQNVISYAGNGLLEDLSELAAKGNLSLTDTFSPQSLEANSLNGVTYGAPISSVVIQMFYNKDILTELGYAEPPKTMEEMYEMSVAATEVDEKGTITRLGYPLFPLASARQELIYAFGGKWWAEDGMTLTPDSPEILDSLNMNVAYRQLYGVEKVQEFIATANTNRYTENDMFFAGKQLFRFDGPWLATMISEYGPDINYGVTLIPGTNANPDYRGSSRYESTAFSIPVVAKEKEGAWEFIQYLTNSAETKDILLGIGSLPALMSLYDDQDLLAQENFAAFIEALKTENGVQYAKINDLAKYNSLIDEYLDYVYNGMMTPEQAMAELKKQSSMLE